ncbi:hypothetical protein [Tautonia sociabilis]|uniref:hypothetical protein n=1 Tax=Tautonia sociabilis TaxID=2080755 RepID=UPI00131542F0|nr:hypothetical protein [Tautonia sociabilis]
MLKPEANTREDVFLLGCGRSVLDLSDADRAAISRSRCVLALNKFILFHDVARITPTHVWFTEDHWPGPRVLRDIFAHCRRNRLEGLTFIITPQPRIFHDRRLTYTRARLGYTWRNALGRKMLEPFLPPPRSRLERVERHFWLDGGSWATEPGQPLFHLRTSFTCALNYLAVTHPGAHIHLIGTDFNSGGYFFEERMARFRGRWDDWTTSTQREQGRHFATIPHEGKTVFDAFPYMREQLDRAGVRVSCPNKESGVVRQGLADYEPIVPADAPVGVSPGEASG